MILAGTGFRTDPQAHFEVATLTGMPVISLELVDPRFYHLDTALTVLDDTTIAYYPPAFTDRARAQLTLLFAEQLYHAGFHPIGVDLSELLKGGGSVKCCTLEVFS